MGLLPPSLPGSQFPGDDALVRKIQDLTRAVNESNNKDPFAGTALVVTSNSLTVNGASTVNTGPFKVNGDSAVSGKLDVGGAATFYVGTAFNGATGLYGPVTVTGGLTCNCDASFTGYTTMSGARFNGGTTFIGDASFSGYTTLSGTRINGVLTVANDASFTGYTTMAGARFNGGTTHIGDASFSGYTTIAGARFTGGLTFDNAPTFPGMTVSGGSTFNAGTTFAAAAPVTFNGSANFNGGSTFASSPSFTTSVNMPNGATVGGTLGAGTTNITGTLTHNGTFNIGSGTGSVSNGSGGVTLSGAAISLSASTTVSGNFSVSGTKAFVMPHPVHPDTMTLMHCATESPVNGVEYWGAATTGADGTVTVTLPGYFEALTKAEERNVQLTPAGRATVIPWASDIVNGAFTINADPGLKINWLVKAERQHLVDGADKLAFEAEQNQPLGGL